MCAYGKTLLLFLGEGFLNLADSHCKLQVQFLPSPEKLPQMQLIFEPVVIEQSILLKYVLAFGIQTFLRFSLP